MTHAETAAGPAAGTRAPDDAIAVSGLVKTFGHLCAVDGLDLHVRRGQIHGFLGPNGAGKSTTIRVLLGMHHRDAGRVRVLGHDPAQEAGPITRRTAYVPGDVALWPSLTGAQTLDAFAALRGRRDRNREAELIDAFNLDPSKPVRSYSKGNRQKVALIAALAAPCDLLVLDEPTTGLDPLQEEVFQTCVREAAAAGRTVLLSSHLLDEVDRVCDAVTIIKDGRTVETGTLAALRHLRDSTITYRLPDGAVPELPRGINAPPAGADGMRRISAPAEDVPEALSALIAAGAQGLTCTPASLEDLFMRHYEGEAR